MITEWDRLSQITRGSFWVVERVLVIDPGESATLIMVAERIMGEIQIRHRVSIPGTLGPMDQLVPETLSQLRDEYAPLRVILIVPQSETVSQRISLKDESIESFVSKESTQFAEVEGNLPVVDHQALPGTSPQAYWLTYCQPHVIDDALSRLGLLLEDIDDVTSAVQGFLGFFEPARTLTDVAFVIDVGRQHSSLMRIEKGMPVYATSFSSALNWAQNQPSQSSLDQWFRRLVSAPKTLHDIAPQSNDFPQQSTLILAGDATLLAPIESQFESQLGICPHFASPPGSASQTPREFSLAQGVAQAALGNHPIKISLLPSPHRTRREQRLVWNRLRGWTTALPLACALILIVGSWQKLLLFRFKNRLIEDAQAAIHRMEQTERTLMGFADQYEQVRPILRFQQETQELIETLRALQKPDEISDYWLVLLADTDSYVHKEIPLSETNSVLESPPDVVRNPLRDHEGFVAELSFASDGEVMRDQLVSLVNRLKTSQLYANVDTLPEDLRRPLALTNVVLPGQHVALSLQSHRNYFARRLSLNPMEPLKGNAVAPGEDDPSSFRSRSQRIDEEDPPSN